MDTVTEFVPRDALTASAVATATLDANRTLTVTATYLLSEDGRKASLLAGGDGRAVQELTIHVPTNRLHLVSVDADGVARLKLRPRYQLDGGQRVVRLDAAPTYDAPPDIQELFREAARNHQLEREYEAQRRAAKLTRRDAGRERRAQVAQAFLSDSTQRALLHPAPSPRRCFLATETGRVMFDIATDEGSAREVPPEAHRRFRADLRVRRERNLQERAAQLALHEEKKRYIADWIATHGTPEQQARQAAGMLPMAEAIEAITEQVFAVLGDRPLYVRDGAERLRSHLRLCPQHAAAVITPADVFVTGTNAIKATAPQWAMMRECQVALPDATVTLRIHKLAWKREPGAPILTLFGILVTQKVGPFTFRREYTAPER